MRTTGFLVVAICIYLVGGYRLAHAQANDVVCSGCVNASDISAKSVTAGKLGNSAVTTDKIAGGAVTSGKIADGGVTRNDIRNGAVSSAKIKDGTIGAADINTDQVQARVSSCPIDTSIREIAPDGSVTCEPDTVTSSVLAPIAFGQIQADGTIDSSSGNISVVYDGIKYVITIDGEGYFFRNYVTVVTPASSSTPRFVGTSSVSGDLLVYVRDVNGAAAQANFAFVTYKP